MNFLVVSIDTMRADRLGRVGRDGASITPSLDALAAQGQRYSRAFAQANETLFSHTALFTGRYPSELGELSYETFRLDPGTPTLAGALGLRGWRTEAYVAGGHLDPVFGLNAGFDHYQSGQPFSTFHQTMPEALEALDRLARESEPWFLFVHGYDVHTPYIKPGLFGRAETPGYDGPLLERAWQPLTYERILDGVYYPDYRPPQMTSSDGLPFLDPKTFAALENFAALDEVRRIPLTEQDKAFVAGTYDTAVRQADFFVGVLLDALDDTGQADETVVIVLSDHGEDLGDHRHYNHRLALFDTNVQVVLITRVPGQAPSVVSDPVGLVDVYATIRQLAGLQQVGRGLPLASARPDRVVYSESMLGQVSGRSRDARLLLPDQAMTPEPPSTAPTGAALLSESGASLPWRGPTLRLLWQGLAQERSR
jgi:arylsulfatase A-like enzyme